jgi:uncharacterized protein YjaZ
MINIQFLDYANYQFSTPDRELITSIISGAEAELRQLLPALSAKLLVTIQASTDVIEETGETGSAIHSELISISINPWDKRGLPAIVRAELRKTLYHEANHVTRMETVPFEESMLAAAIFEGLGTAFERDFAGATPPWGDYDPVVINDWAREVMALPASLPEPNDWYFNHPDGRRWIAYKVGTYIVDQAMEHGGKTSATLVSMSAAEILQLAKIT